MTARPRLPQLAILAITLTTFGAQAHTGHGTHSLMEGLAHPFGADHLLAMVAVGLWSVSALPARKAWQGPATFMLALVLSAIAGAMGFAPAFLEHAIALSVVLFGAMLVWPKTMPTTTGLAVITTAASLHGLAHGAETPTSGFAGYAFGFLLTTATLHLLGAAAGLSIHRLLAERSRVALGGMGMAIAGAGVYLFSQI